MVDGTPKTGFGWLRSLLLLLPTFALAAESSVERRSFRVMADAEDDDEDCMMLFLRWDDAIVC